MQLLVKPLLFAAFSLVIISTANAAISVGVIGGGNSSASQLAAQLNDDTHFDFAATVIGASDADSAAELAAYDVVIIGDSGYSNMGYTAAMFAALRNYLDAGGGIVSVGWYNYGTIPYGGQMDIDADYVTPIVTTNANHFDSAPGTVNVLSNAHPITSGISDYAYSGNNIEVELAVDAGAVVLGTVSGSPHSGTAIAYQDLIGRSVYLGGLYMASTGYNNSGLRVGVEDQLLEQSVAWAAQASAIPEPSTYIALTGMILCFGLAGWWRKRRQAA